MIARVRQLLDVVCAVVAVPHLIQQRGALALRLVEVEKRVGELELGLDDVDAVISEIYVGPRLVRRCREHSGTAAS